VLHGATQANDEQFSPGGFWRSPPRRSHREHRAMRTMLPHCSLGIPVGQNASSRAKLRQSWSTVLLGSDGDECPGMSTDLVEAVPTAGDRALGVSRAGQSRGYNLTRTQPSNPGIQPTAGAVGVGYKASPWQG
jgi:hypothetical protein